MLPINLLQSQLAHNKKRINELQESIYYTTISLRDTCRRIKEIESTGAGNRYIQSLSVHKHQFIKDLQKTRKQLKQLAILQKAIKTSISLQEMEEAYLDAEYNNIGV